jgi:protein-S-isoprenylcysteine O-methyltransferase Ste14
MTAIGVGWFLIGRLEPRVGNTWTSILGVALGVIAVVIYGISSKVGRLRNPAHYSLELRTDGIYRFVRHPQALALSLLSIGVGLFSASVPFLLSVPLWMGAWWAYTCVEERLELLPTFGAEYRAYCRTTPRIWPRLGPLLRAKARSRLGPGGC